MESTLKKNPKSNIPLPFHLLLINGWRVYAILMNPSRVYWTKHLWSYGFIIAQWVYHDYEIGLYSTNSTQEYAVLRIKVDYCTLSTYGFFIAHSGFIYSLLSWEGISLCIPRKTILRLQGAIRYFTPRSTFMICSSNRFDILYKYFRLILLFWRISTEKSSSSFIYTPVINFITMQRMKYLLRVS